MAQAFQWLRRYDRDHNRRLVDVAQDLINGELDVESALFLRLTAHATATAVMTTTVIDVDEGEV